MFSERRKSMKKSRFFRLVCIVLCTAACILGSAFTLPADPGTDAESAALLLSVSTVGDVKSIPDVKQNIYDNVLNCVDFYDAVKGSFTTTFIRSGENVTVGYAVDIPAQVSVENISGRVEDLTQVCVDETMYTFNRAAGLYSHDYYASQIDTVYRSSEVLRNICLPHGVKPAFYNGGVPVYNRVVTTADGEHGYYYRPDITNTAFACASIYPQSLVMALMSDFDFWEITDVADYLGRQCIVISGTVADEDYAKKINSDSFSFVFDIQTGIMLDFKGYSNGEISQSITTQDICFMPTGTDNGIWLDAQKLIAQTQT